MALFYPATPHKRDAHLTNAKKRNAPMNEELSKQEALIQVQESLQLHARIARCVIECEVNASNGASITRPAKTAARAVRDLANMLTDAPTVDEGAFKLLGTTLPLVEEFIRQLYGTTNNAGSVVDIRFDITASYEALAVILDSDTSWLMELTAESETR
jgi:hypothetical protein